MTKIVPGHVVHMLDADDLAAYLSAGEWKIYAFRLSPPRRLEVATSGIAIRVFVGDDVVYHGSNPADAVAAYNDAAKS
jgi:hypothetical protein